MEPQPHSLPSRIVLGALVLGAYMAIANTVQQLYPFSVFDMYAHRATSASRVAVRDGTGAVSEVTAWIDWQCDGTMDLGATHEHDLPTAYSIPYRDREAQQWLQQHQGAGPQAVDVVRHIWWLEPQPGQPESEDRALLHCKAVRP